MTLTNDLIFKLHNKRLILTYFSSKFPQENERIENIVVYFYRNFCLFILFLLLLFFFEL